MSQGLYNPFFQNGAYWYGQGGYTPSPEYQAVLDYDTSQGYQQPTAKQIQNEDALMLELKSTGILARSIGVYVFRTNGDIDHACVNWVAPGTFQCLKSATIPYHIRKEGDQGDGATAMYFNTQIILNTHGGSIYTTSKSAIAVGILTNVDDSGDLEFGAADGSNADRTFILGRTGANIAYCMSASTSRSVANGSNSIGRYIVKRSGSTISIHKNGSLLDSTTVAATGLPNVALYILGENGNGTARNFSGRRVSYVFIGDYDGLETAIDTAITNYETRCLEDDPDERIITFIGDSITNGTGTTKGLSYPVQTLVKLNRPLDYRNLSTPGYTTQQMIDNFIPVLGNYLDPDAVVVLFPGTNDIRNGISAATAWTNTQTLVSAIQSYGVTRIVLCTLMADTDRTAGQEIEAQALITSVRNGAAGIGCVVADFAANPNLSTWSATYFADPVHPNNLGAGEMATITNTPVDALI